jgi:LemA protein
MIILITLAALAIFLVSLYNNFVRLRNIVDEGWSGIDVQLKRRSDLIPNLVETVKGYAGHEKKTLEEVVALRNQASSATTVADKSQAESALTAGLGRLFAIAEAYPDLKANQNYQQLQTELSGLEEQIQFARRFYNGAVRDYNTSVQSFPGNLLAGATGFNARQFFELENPAERAVPKVQF